MKRLRLLLIALFIFSSAQAQDRYFARTYQTNILPQGVMEVEFWNTVRSGREHFYRALDQRLEFEVGLGGNLQTSLYMNLYTKSEAPDDSTISTSTHAGFSNEWKYKLSDPVVNSIGSGLYAEIGFDGEEWELEGKLLLDKQIGRNVFAFNLVGEFELEYEYESDEGKIEAEVETPVELDFAYMHLFGPKQNIGLGLEVRDHNEIGEEGWENSAWFAGPSFHVHGSRWWININVQPQIANTHHEDGETGLDTEHHDKLDARAILCFTL